MEKVIQKLYSKPIGTMAATVSSLLDSNDEVILAIKESNFLINTISTDEPINIRGCIIESENSFALVVMFMFNNDRNLMYDLWLNFYDDSDVLVLDRLCEKERIIINYYDSNMKQSKQFVTDNCLMGLSKEYIDKSIEKDYWNNNDFEELKKNINDSLQSIDIMWDNLEKGDEVLC